MLKKNQHFIDINKGFKMAKEIKLPELGEDIESAAVLSVLVKAGDKVEKEQGIIEIETDKATVEVPSEVEGKIKEVKVKEGDQIKTGQVIATLEEDGKEEKSEEEEDKEGESEDTDKEEDAGKKEKSEETEKEDDEKEDTDEKEESEETLKDNKKEARKEKKETKTEEKAEPKTRQSKESNITEFKLPDLGESIEAADVLNILVKEGDKVEKDEGLLEIETDKATVEVPSTIKGTVKEVLVKSGDKVKTGQALFKIESMEDESEAEAEEDIKEDTKEKREKEEPAEKEEKREKGKTDGSKIISASEMDTQPPIKRGAAPAAPSVRRLAREIGVDINEVKGSGQGDRITMDDVKAHSKKMNEQKSAGGTLGIKAEKLPNFSKFGEIERNPMSNVRAKTADHLSYAWAAIPHVTQHDKADITELEKMRKSYSPTVEKAGAKLTVTSILVKVIIAALKKYPQFNSSIDMEKKEVIYKKYFNIGIAVDTEHGLIVPVLKNVEDKNLIDISVEINDLAEKARNRKISLDDLQGSCFTITNLGGIGGTSFTPIVNSPEVAILGVSRGSFEPVYRKKEDFFEPRLMLPLSLSYDHRIIDGADAARFLRFICEVLEQPLMIL